MLVINYINQHQLGAKSFLPYIASVQLIVVIACWEWFWGCILAQEGHKMAWVTSVIVTSKKIGQIPSITDPERTFIVVINITKKKNSWVIRSFMYIFSSNLLWTHNAKRNNFLSDPSLYCNTYSVRILSLYPGNNSIFYHITKYGCYLIWVSFSIA